MARLTGTSSHVDLGGGVSLVAPGLVGEAQLYRAGPPLGGGRSDEPARVTENLGLALDLAGLRQREAVEITAATRPVPGGAGATTRDGRAGFVLTVPDPGQDARAVLLMVDEAGVLSWHYPTGTGAPVSRGGGSIDFVLPRELATPVTVAGTEQDPAGRSIVTAVGKKLLSVLVYPVARAAVGMAAQAIARLWEKNSRPYGVRRFTPAEAHTPGAGALNDTGWRHLAEGRALLFSHGTFSTSSGGFGALPDRVLGALAAAYSGRVFAFDHPTVSVDPIANAREFLDRVPPDVSLDIDIVCHSRGGLVARLLAGELTDLPTGRLRVRRIVFVGTPNTGTALADPVNMGNLVDRYTSLLNLLPPGPWSTVSDVFEGVLEVVKIIGQGALGGLPGLAAMNPTSPFLHDLNLGPNRAEENYAIDADFEPTGSLVRLTRLADSVVDRAFGQKANDMVVPTKGVGTVPGDPGFPVPETRRLHYPAGQAVWHCSYFGQPETATKLQEWLAGEARPNDQRP